jgi:succinate dehydrogenase / fumarate reductase cytochrome b subunit
MIEKHIQMMLKLLQVASITKKITLAIIGLFLVSFLVVHLGINLCLLRNDGGEWFRAAAHFMGTNYLIKAFEIVLFAAIGLHIAIALFLQYQNWRARPVGYAAWSKTKTMFGSKLMIWSGLLVATFIVVHMVQFWFVKIGWAEGRYAVKIEHVEKAIGERQYALSNAYMNTQDEQEMIRIETEFMELRNAMETNEQLQALMFPAKGGVRWIADLSRTELNEILEIVKVKYEPDFYAMVRDLFKIGWMVILYLLFMVALGFHLSHAVPSAFQTLGLAHSKYTWIIKIAGIAFAIMISVGFAILPIYFYLFY